jgi:hypothetical protein
MDRSFGACACAGAAGGAPGRRREQHGVRGGGARPGPRVRLRRRHLAAAEAGERPQGAAGARARRARRRPRPARAPPRAPLRRGRRLLAAVLRLRRRLLRLPLASPAGGGRRGQPRDGRRRRRRLASDAGRPRRLGRGGALDMSSIGPVPAPTLPTTAVRRQRNAQVYTIYIRIQFTCKF